MNIVVVTAADTATAGTAVVVYARFSGSSNEWTQSLVNRNYREQPSLEETPRVRPTSMSDAT